MAQELAAVGMRPRFQNLWPWVVFVLLTLPAFWHVVHYEADIDVEFPKVIRPTFSLMPSPAYRLAEPGDTIDRVAIYFSCAGIVFCSIGLLANRGKGLWPAGLALMLAGFWEASNPGPSLDQWHGLGWRAVVHPATPLALRLGLMAGAVALASILAGTLWINRRELGQSWDWAKLRGNRLLWIVGFLLLLARYGEIPGIEPQGYWPRWSLVWGLLAIDLCLLRELPRFRLRKTILLTPAVFGCWLLLVLGGIWLTWYHRPLSRLRPVVHDKIYISAMPTRQGLEVAYKRHPFKTIINLYPEDLLERSPYFDEEREFAEQHGIQYVLSPSDTSLEASKAFLDRTLQLAQDPSAWPILVHCHACMDRTPAWMGIYRFLVQGTPLLEIMREIEQHRGYRPKSSVTLLYNRVLSMRDPERYAADPTAAILREAARGVIDPALSRESETTRSVDVNRETRAGVSPEQSSSAADDRGQSRRR